MNPLEMGLPHAWETLATVPRGGVLEAIIIIFIIITIVILIIITIIIIIISSSSSSLLRLAPAATQIHNDNSIAVIAKLLKHMITWNTYSNLYITTINKHIK